MFRIKFLPAMMGDCIWLTYGSERDPHYVLIDGGTAGTSNYIVREIENLPTAKRKLDLVVVSHIDSDHIGGILAVLKEGRIKFEFGDLWFNALKHLPAPFLGEVQAEELTKVLESLGPELPWNDAFENGAVQINGSGQLPTRTLEGGLKLTLVSPAESDLQRLAAKWKRVLDGEPELPMLSMLSYAPPKIRELAQTRFLADTAPANGSSIAFLAEFEGRRALFAADAHADRLLSSIRRLSPDGRLKVDLLKVSHHGSAKTTSRDLIAGLDCNRFVFSTNGSVHHHPDRETVARILVESTKQPTLYFNYVTEFNRIWSAEDLQNGEFPYRTVYPEGGESVIELQL